VPGSVRGMEEARQILERLARIEQLEREHAPAGKLLDELRELVQEAETWLRAEPEPAGAVAALARCRNALAVEERQEVMLLAR
jgi:triphosphoribosyl-dephospho-CoA synthetase